MQSFHNSWYWKHIYLTCDWINSYHSCSPCIQYRSSPPEVFLGKGVPKICSKFTGKHPCRSVQRNFIEITFWYGCSPINWLHAFGTPFPKNTSVRLLLMNQYTFRILIYSHKHFIPMIFTHFNTHYCIYTYYCIHYLIYLIL